MQSHQVASDGDIAGAIQIAGEVVKYDNIEFQLNRIRLQSGLQPCPAVSDFVYNTEACVTTTTYNQHHHVQ